MAAAAVNAPPPPIEEAVEQIRDLLKRREAALALAAADVLLVRAPDARDAWYLKAVSERYLGRIEQALASLARLEQIHPSYSRLFQERGHCHAARRAVQPAIEAYLHAVHLNPALPPSWMALQALYRASGDAVNAETAAQHVATLARLPAEILTASTLFADGANLEAERIVRAFLMQHETHVEGMRLLARIGLKLDVLDDAEFLLESVLTLAPDYHAARYDYACVLLERQKHLRAREELETLLAIEPENRAYLTSYATVSVALGDYARALALYRQLLIDRPQAAEIHLSIAHALKTAGSQQEAIDAYRAAAAARPQYGDAYWSLANLKTYRFPDDELARMRTAEAMPTTSLVDRYHLCFALGKALEDRAEYAESFRWYERGNALKRSESRFSVDPIERNARLQTEICTAGFFESRRGTGCESSDPIFIVGLPRSGSTLLEQILASHSSVEGTMELGDIARLVNALNGRERIEGAPRYPGVLASLEPGELRALGEKYLADTRAYRSGKPLFVDKMPNNFRHIGLIHLILPNARIIDARRAPVACCFGNFKQLFATGQEFTYGLEDIARYYRIYVELMDHWNAVLPGKILRVQHENLVEDLEGNVRRLLDFCGLEFEPGCLEFYKTDRSVRTASSEQVRQPIFKQGLDQWRHFEPWLGPLKQALGSLI
ncbi:MAG: sulfotransferase [Steroidobacteraceae bacterium]|jgi:tetratricopeptide (TPR) repeat protein